MASTYSNLKIQLMATGENSGTWGNVTNANLGDAIEQALVETATVTFASANVTLTLSNSNSKQDARALRLNLAGTTGGARDLIVPAIQKPYIVNNGTADIITVKVSGQTGVAVPAGKTMTVYNNGTDVVDMISHLSSLTLNAATPLGPSSGGTGLNTVGTSGNVLTSNGTAWASTALPPSFVTGMILLWSGSIATIPSGWALCNGSNGTPDLRDRFIVGAGNTYAVAATGGATSITLATTNLPSHTHSFSANATTGSTGIDSHTHAFSGTTAGGGSHNHNISDPGHSHSVGTNTLRQLNSGQVGRTDASQSTHYNNTGNATTGITIANVGNHDHTYSGNTGNTSGTGHTHSVGVSGTTGSTGSGTSISVLNPYYALAYIMKL